YGFAAFFVLSYVAASSLLRVVLFVSFKTAQPAPFGEVCVLFLSGFHRDVFAALALAVPLLVWFLIVPNRWFTARWHRLLVGGGFFLFWAVQAFSFAAEYYFFEEFRSRFNTVAVDYVVYPHEVFINIRESYPFGTVVAACAAFGA